ncbi:MAG: sigma-70 family RNA polymerase sigma factor [Chloroflexi bacterium]|nr:sigma-70 family RNA polymerase sigma factor [Chloroflexota bacterium]
MVLQYAPLVKYVAGRLAIMLPRVMDSDDVLSSGVLGLIEAIDRFDPTTGVKFETYAISRIRGAILDELRSLDWIPRSARQRSQEIAKAFTRLEVEYGRPPTDEEVARTLGLDMHQYHQASISALYYEQELTMKEISMVLDVSESRVCQLHGRAVHRLRSQLSTLMGAE